MSCNYSRAICITLTFIAIALPARSFASDIKDVIVLPAAMGDITFLHKKHQVKLNGCKDCHTNDTGKITELGIDWGHRICRGCHISMKIGLTECIDCHKKKSPVIQ